MLHIIWYNTIEKSFLAHESRNLSWVKPSWLKQLQNVSFLLNEMKLTEATDLKMRLAFMTVVKQLCMDWFWIWSCKCGDVYSRKLYLRGERNHIILPLMWEIKIFSVEENHFIFPPPFFARKMDCTKLQNNGLHGKSEQFSSVKQNPLVAHITMYLCFSTVPIYIELLVIMHISW